MYELESENLTGLGGPMGSESISTNFRRYFKSLASAKKFAEKDYGGKIPWHTGRGDKIHSGDLGHVMYHIRLIRTVD